MGSYEPGSEIDISILVLTYHSNWTDLENTLESVLVQKDICHEIVVSDDGSEETHKEQLIQFFEKKNYPHYTLVCNRENRGTVRNAIAGLENCKGKWVKDISPGDFLYGDRCLARWVEYCEKNNCLWSFSEAVYYEKTQRGIEAVSCRAHPMELTPYIKGETDRCRWNYVALNDIALGATMVCHTDLYLSYCRQIEGKVIYAEDNVWRLLMFDGIVGGYYPETTVLYENGVGISTSGQGPWTEKMNKDWRTATDIILSRENGDELQKKMQKAYRDSRSKIWRYFVRGKLRFEIKKRLFPRMATQTLPEGILICK